MLEHFWDARAFRILFTTLVFVLVLGFLHGARTTLTLFLFAILFAYFLQPLVVLLERRVKSHTGAIGIVYLALLILLVVAGFLLGPMLANEAKSLIISLPGLVNQFTTGDFLTRIKIGKTGLSPERAAQIHGYLLAHRTTIIGYAEGAASRLGEPLSHLWWLILIPILSFFFLQSAPEIAVGIVEFGGSRTERTILDGIVEDVNVMLGGYIRSQLILAGLTMVALTLVLSLMRVPYAFILGPLAGLFEFIPVVGPAVACVLIFGLAVILGYTHLLWLFLFLGTWRLIQDYVNAPRIMGRTLEIAPLVQIFGVLAGGEIGGVIGALVAVPVLAILRILWRRMSAPKVNQYANQPHAAE